MLTFPELNTICAALKFWEEEICPHGKTAMAPYFRQGESHTLTAEQVRELRGRLLAMDLCYGLVGPTSNKTLKVYTSVTQAQADLAPGYSLASVLVPRRSRKKRRR